ncbi:MAG TPA: transcriptional regulator [Pseudomonas sp.]|nr:transcriptional regulator [Pseudomonas sp.]
MSRHHEDQQNSASRNRRQQEDLRRMQFRRAIEEYSELRRLQQELGGYPDLIPADFLPNVRIPQHHAA